MNKEKGKIIELILHLVFLTILVLASTRPVGAQRVAKSPTLAATATKVIVLERQATHSTSSGLQPEPSAERQAAASKKPEYQLPYPGLLPDHPLYILKTIRDRIIDFLIADSLKEAEFTLLQADKRLAASIVLVEKGKHELAEDTVSKGENYLARSVESLRKASSEGKDTAALKGKLAAALNKHEETLRLLAGKAEGKVKDRFTQLASDIVKFRDSLQK